MKRFVAPLGFSGHLVTRPVIAHGIDANHTVILVYPEQTESSAAQRVENAINDVESTLTGVVHSVNIKEETVPPDDFNAAVDICSDVLTREQSPIVCLGGGATDVHLPMTVATLAHYTYLDDVMMYSDTRQAAGPVSLPDITSSIPPETEDTFDVICRHRHETSHMSVSELADAAGIAISTASRHVSTLSNNGVVRLERTAQSKAIELTTLGRLYARNRDQTK